MLRERKKNRNNSTPKINVLVILIDHQPNKEAGILQFHHSGKAVISLDDTDIYITLLTLA